MSNFFYIKNGALVPAGSAATPTLSTINDDDTGLYFSAANTLSIATGGTQRFDFSNTGLLSASTGGGMLAYAAASGTVPTLIPNKSDATAGIGANVAGNVSILAGATEVVRITSGDMTMMNSARFFLVADPSDDLEASTKRYVDDSVATAVTSGAAGDGLTFSTGALNVGTASSSRIVINANNIDLATIGTAGTYQSVTVDAYGRVSAGLSITNLTSATASTSDEIAVASAANSFEPRKVTLSSLLSAVGTVSTGRTISTTAPLAGGGDLSANRTLTFSITSLINTALTGSDELVAADATAGFAPVKRTISSLISDLSIWTATNDGAASGLDADLLDGQHGSYYAIATRSIATTLPLAGGGDLSADRTLSLNITGLTNTAVTSSDEIVVADATAGFAPIKRTLGNALSDLGVISGLTPTDNGVVIGNGSAFVVETGATLKTSLGLTIGTDVQAYSANLTTWSGLSPSANGQSLVTAVDYSAMRTLLGLVIGTNVQAYDADLTTWAGLTPSANAQSLVTAADYAAMKALLDLEIGVDVQAYDADLTTWAGLTPSANAQSLVTAADYSAMRTLLGLVIGTNVQAYDADLTTWAGLTPSANAQSLVTAADYSAMRTLLGLVIGTNVQAYDAELSAIAGLTSAADRLPYFTGSGTAALATFTTAGRNLIDDADNTAQRTTLGLGTAATQNTGTSGATLPFLNGANTWSADQVDTNAQGWKLVTGAGSSTAPTIYPNRTYNAGISSVTAAPNGADIYIIAASAVSNAATSVAKFGALAITNYVSVSDSTAGGYILKSGAASSTVPTLIPLNSHQDTGIGSAGADTVSIIALSTETARYTSTAITHYASVSDTNAAGYRLVTGATSGTAPTLVPNKAAATTGIGAQASGNVSVIASATETSRFTSSLITNFVSINDTNAAGYQLTTGAASSTAPTLLPNKASTTTGIGAQASGNISLIASGTEAVRVTSTDVSIRGSVTMTLAVDPSSALHAVTKQYVDNRKETIWVPGAGMISRTTNGAAAGTAETTTHKVMIKTLDFDASTIEYAQFQVNMPKSWNESTMTAVFVWSHASTTTNFGVVWGIQGLATSDDDALDTAFGTAVTVTDTGGTTNDIYRTSETSAFTIGNTPAENDVVTFQVYRNATDGSDTIAIDARLHGVMLFYTTNAVTDA